MYLSVALWNITYVIVPEAFSNKTPWFGFVVWVPAFVVSLKRSQLGQLLLSEPLSLETEIKIILFHLILSVNHSPISGESHLVHWAPVFVLLAKPE